MADSLHQIEIHADKADVFKALTTNPGIQGWWTSDCAVASDEGGLCHFYFNNRQTHFVMRAQKLLSNQRIFWVCEDGPKEWQQTELWWEITEIAEKHCQLDFKHMNWQRDDGLFPLCNSTWGTLMSHLKNYCETGSKDPLFTDPISISA